ncbi:MAG TPA: hypothetical protein VKT80_09525 [Chloroflexota bacterium]|nr:hypothetical protein [Chloroflexota bacterium]
MIVWFSLLVAIGGMIIFLAFKDKVSELGKIAFAAGLLAFLLQAGPRLVQLFGK